MILPSSATRVFRAPFPQALAVPVKLTHYTICIDSAPNITAGSQLKPYVASLASSLGRIENPRRDTPVWPAVNDFAVQVDKPSVTVSASEENERVVREVLIAKRDPCEPYKTHCNY
jgi:hypothetical protein